MCAGGTGILLSLTLMPTYSRAREFERTSIGNVAQLQPNTYTSSPLSPTPPLPALACAVVLPLSQAQLGQALASIATVPTPKSIPNPVSYPPASPCPPWVTPPPKSVEAAAAAVAAAVRCHTEAGAPLPLWLRVHHAAASTLPLPSLAGTASIAQPPDTKSKSIDNFHS